MNDDQRKQRAVVRDSAEAEVTDMCLFFHQLQCDWHRELSCNILLGNVFER